MDIEKAFRHTKSLSEDGKTVIAAAEDMFVEVASAVNKLPDSREKSLALTKLQEAKFWAVECIAKNTVEEG